VNSGWRIVAKIFTTDSRIRPSASLSWTAAARAGTGTLPTRARAGSVTAAAINQTEVLQRMFIMSTRFSNGRTPVPDRRRQAAEPFATDRRAGVRAIPTKNATHLISPRAGWIGPRPGGERSA